MPRVFDPITGRFRWVEYPQTFDELSILNNVPRDPVVMDMQGRVLNGTADALDRFLGRVPATPAVSTPAVTRTVATPAVSTPAATRTVATPAAATTAPPDVIDRFLSRVPPPTTTSVTNKTRTFQEAAREQAKNTASKSTASTASTATAAAPARTATPTVAAPAAAVLPPENLSRSSDGRVSYRNGRRIDSLGNYAVGGGALATPIVESDIGAPMAQPGGAFGFGVDPFVSGQVPLPEGQYYPADVYAGYGGPLGDYSGMPWMQNAAAAAGYGGGFFGGGAFPGAGNNMLYWPNLTDPQVQRNLAVLNAQFPWTELQESTRRDNRNFFEQTRNNLFNRRATAYSTASRAALPNVREIG